MSNSLLSAEQASCLNDAVVAIRNCGNLLVSSGVHPAMVTSALAQEMAVQLKLIPPGPLRNTTAECLTKFILAQTLS